ncbi:MAG: RHS repeat protein, partial [Clostridia bacterium]|nr:RHS repeat protein [Clostridia bacterium]
MKKIFYSLITTLVVTIFCSIPALAVSTSEVLSSATVQEILENNYSTDFNPPSSRESSEYIDTFTGSLSLSENIISLPGKNGLDVNLSISYNSQEIGKSFSYDTTSYDTAANPTAFYYTYVNDSGSTKNILVVFEDEYELLNTAPISFTAKELPNPSEDDNGDEYYKYSSFKTSYDDIVFTRNLDMAPFELYISASTKLTTTDINAKAPEVGSIWTWNLPRVLSNIRPTKTETISGVEYYDLYTAFIDADGEYRQLWFTYEKEDGDITYKSMDALSTVKYTCWYDDPQGDTVDSVRGITYHCKIRDTQGRIMYFAKLGNLVAIEDRFGNIIKYTFENKRLSKIVDTLGRIISVEYVNNDVYVYVDYDGEGDAEPVLYTKILYSAENDNTLDPNNYLISDDTYTSTIVRFEDNNTENRTVYTYKKWHALYSLSNIAYRYEYCVCNVITNITHPNNLSTSYTYEKAKTSAGCSKKDYFVVARCDFDNDLPFNAITYDYTTKPSASSSSYKTVKTRSADSLSETFSGASYLQTKTSVSDNVTLTETYEYTTSRGRRKVKLLTQQFKNGTTSGVAREISTPYTNFRPSGIAYDDYEKTITYHDDSNFIATETYNQSEDVLIKTAYTLSPEGDNFYTGRTIGSATVSQSTDGGDSYTEKYTVEYTYNPDGTPASCVVDPDGINQVTSYSYVYGTDGSITTTSVTSNLKDADGNPVDNITTSSKIDYLGRLLWTQDGNGNRTYFEYDRLGRIIKQTNPDLTFRTYAYSTSDRTVIVTDENGVMEKALYNGFGNILSVYKNVGTVQSPVWVPVLEYEYDALCRPILSVTYTGYNEQNTPNKWVETHYTYGAFDNVADIATYDEEGTELSCESYTYNFADRIGSTTSAIEPHDVTNGGTSRKFTSVTVESSPKDGITPPTVKQYLDRQGRLVKQVTTDGSSEYVSTYIYDTLGNVLEFKDEAAYADYDVDYSQKFEYNYNNQVIKAYNAEGNYITNTYDTLGRQLTSTDYMGNTQTYTYDSIGRVLTASAPVDDNVTSLTSYYYDSNSNITSQVASAAAGNITYTYTYDSLNRPVTAFNGSTYSVNQYEGSRIVKTASGLESSTADISELLPSNTTYNVVGYVYNSLGYLASETTFNGTTTYTYDLAGNTLTVTDPKGITTTNTYDIRGNLITSTAQGDVIAYSYNAFNLVTEASRNGVATTYTYDNLARNITETTGTDTIARSYNTAGQVETMSLTRSGVVL